jgi:hypothetical protein
MRHPHRATGPRTLGDFNVSDVGVVLQGESSERISTIPDLDSFRKTG